MLPKKNSKSESEQEILAPEQIRRQGFYAARYLTLCHCLTASFALVEKSGQDEVNPSIIKAIENAAAVELQGADAFTVMRIAKFATENGDRALAACDAPNEVTRCLAVAYAICKFVEQGTVDAESTLAVTALGLVMESDDDNDQTWRKARRPKYYADIIFAKCDAAMLTY